MSNSTGFTNLKLGDFEFPFGVTLTVNAEDNDAVTVNGQVLDGNNDAMATRVNLPFFISDDANGDSIAATAPDGGFAAGTNGWVDVITTGKSGRLMTEADGTFDIVVTESGSDVFYLGVVMPDGHVVMSGAMTFAA
jgi:hypothetical protein